MILKLAPNPFINQEKSSKVFIQNSLGPYQNTREALSRINLSPAKGKKVLLKPNCGRLAKPEAAITTHPQVLAAAIDAFQEAGAEVTVGESPIAGVDTMKAFEETGMADAARERNCPLIDMDKRKYVEIDLPNGRAIQKLKLCPEILEHDLIVSIPVIKMHMHTGVTLAVKNMKGCLWRRSKVKLHMLPPTSGFSEKSLDIAIADMAQVLRPHLSIIDGNYCMEGLGPSAGQVQKLDLTLVSADPFAADSIACFLIGRQAAAIPHLYLAAGPGKGEIDPEKIKVYPDDWRKLKRRLALPPENIAVTFKNINILDKNSCSACQSTLLLFLKRYGKEIYEYFPDPENINIAIGKGHADLPADTLCIGNCTRAHRQKGIYVKGCPPVGSEILKKLRGRESDDIFDGQSRMPEGESDQKNK